MKKMIFIILFTFVLIFTNGIYLKLHALSYPSEVDVVWIDFNYDINSYIHDALSIVHKEAKDEILRCQWYKGGEVNWEIAYIKNQTNRRIQVLFQHNQDTTQSYSVVIEADVDSGTGLGNGSKMVYFPSYNKAESDTITFQLNGTLPSSVGIEGFKFTWDAMMPVQIHYGYTGTHKYYTLLAAPKAPMEIPWTDVLDYACDWADGETDTIGVLNKITVGAYENFPVNYIDDETHSLLPNCNLTLLLNDTTADCRDMSAIFQIFANALGIANTHVRHIGGGVYGLFTKEIDPIGTPDNWDSSGWDTAHWTYHRVGVHDSYGSKMWDATMRLNRYYPRVPINENILNPYKVDLYYSGGFYPSYVYTYTKIDGQ